MDLESFGMPIGIGKEAEVFDAGLHVLKLYRAGASKTSAFGEAAILSVVEEKDVGAPTVIGVGQHGGRWGITMTRAGGPTFAEQMKVEADRPRLVLEMARLHAMIHSRPGPPLPSQRDKLQHAILGAPQIEGPLRRRLLAGLDDMPAGDRLCHGDFHPFNILGRPGEAMIVDWLDASQGDPAADVCRTYVLLAPVEPELARQYVSVYAELAGLPAEQVFRWLPFVAAARLNEGVPHEDERLLAMADRIGQ